MTQLNRLKSWQRYEDSRRGCPDRRRRERARDAMRTVPKGCRCELCNTTGATVWHHPDYRLPREAIELCHTCHRREHPR